MSEVASFRQAADHVLRRIARAEQQRVERESLWRSLQHYVRPTALAFRESQGSADARERRILESTAARSLELFASFLMSSVLVAGTAGAAAFRFVGVGPDGKEVASPSAKEWLENAVKEVRAVLFSGAYSATGCLHNVCLDLGLYGTSCFAAWEGPDPLLRPVIFKHYPVWRVCGELGEGERPAFISVQEELTVQQATARWPEAAEAGMFSDRDGQAPVKVRFVCISREDGDFETFVPPNIAATNAAWAGVWYLEEHKYILDARGYSEQPIFLPAWYIVDGTVWGRSPAMTALGDVISANVLMEMIIKGTEKLVEPPWLVRDGALLSPLRAYPNGITYTDGDQGLQALLPPGASRIEMGVDMLRDRAAQIERAFFVHLFQDTPNPLGSRQPRTATEVAIQQDERNRAVTPMVMRLQATMIEPLLWRVLGLLVRSGRLPAPPLPEGARLAVRHQSPVVASQAQVDGIAIMRYMESLVSMAQVNPEVLDFVNMDAAAKLLHTASGAPAAVLRQDSEVKRLRAQRAEQATAAQQMQVANEGGKTLAALISAQAKGGTRGGMV
jgi:hypothetical protein